MEDAGTETAAAVAGMTCGSGVPVGDSSASMIEVEVVIVMNWESS